MSCFPCFSSHRSKKSTGKEPRLPTAPGTKKPKSGADTNNREEISSDNGNVPAQTFTFRELASATKNFRQECLLGEGGFGRVYKGTLQGTGQVVAVKQLDRTGLQGNKEFLVEVLMLTSLHHPNLVNLIGYCADGDQRLLVYEYMSGGSLEDHVLESMPERKPLDWSTRMKIAYGAAQGLEYLHDKANPSVIYRDLKSSNILLDENFNPKLSDFGLAKLGPMGEKMHVSSRVVGTYGYCAPEYARTGQLTMKSDVFSFGVVLLELITGRRAIDTTKPIEEQNLVSWAQPMFRDPKKFPYMADPLLNRHFPETSLNQAVAIAAMCLQEEASARPFMSDVVSTLSFLSMVQQESIAVVSASTPPSIVKIEDGQNEGKDSSTDGEDDSSDNHDEDSENEFHQTIVKEKSFDKKSSHQISIGSLDESVSSRCKGSSNSSSCKGSMNLSQVGNASISDHNKKKSRICSRNGNRRSNNESSSLGRLSSMESENGIISSGRSSSSVGSSERSVNLSCNSSRGSHDGSICLDLSSNRDSDHESFSVNKKYNRGSLDGSVYSS